MKIKEGFILRKLGTKYIVVALNGEASKLNYLIKLNSLGAFLWEKLSKEDCSIKQLIEQVLNEYEADELQVEKDVNEFIELLRKNNILKDE